MTCFFKCYAPNNEASYRIFTILVFLQYTYDSRSGGGERRREAEGYGVAGVKQEDESRRCEEDEIEAHTKCDHTAQRVKQTTPSFVALACP